MTVIDPATRRHAEPDQLDVASAQESAAPTSPPSRMIDPTPVAVALLAVQLLIFAVRWWGASAEVLGNEALETALAASTLVAGGAQLLAGIFGFIRGDRYVSHVAAVVGLWLLGLYFLTTNEAMEPASVGWYNILLAVLLVIIMVPAVVQRLYPFICAFSSISIVLVLSGFGFLGIQAAEDAEGAGDLSVAATLLSSSAWFAIIGAVSLLWILAKHLYAESGLFGAGEAQEA